MRGRVSLYLFPGNTWHCYTKHRLSDDGRSRGWNAWNPCRPTLSRLPTATSMEKHLDRYLRALDRYRISLDPGEV